MKASCPPLHPTTLRITAALSINPASLGKTSQISIPGTFVLNRLELTTNLAGRFGLDLPQILVWRSTGKKDVDDCLVRVGLPRGCFGSKQIGEREPTRTEGESADLQETASRYSVTITGLVGQRSTT